MPRVIISSGHTSQNPGKTVGSVREVDLTRKITSALVPLLRGNGVLTLTTPKELEPEEKIQWINKTGYRSEFKDVAIEIQLNQGNGSKSGAVGWYGGKNSQQSQELAKDILESVKTESGIENLGVFNETTHPSGKIKFINESSPIGVIIGAGFVDNSKDLEFLQSDEKVAKLAKGMAKGITKFLKIEYKDVTPPKPIVQQQIQNKPAPTTPSVQNDMLYGSGGSNFYGGNFSNNAPKPANGNSYLASREERKDMIRNNYIKILGREPNQSDLNYFLNTGITEDQLLKKMVESQEHADLVKARQDVLLTKAQFHGQQAEILQLRADTADKADIVNNLNALLAQKNIALAEMHKRIQLQFPEQQGSQFQKIDEPEPKYKKSLTDRLFGFFSDRLG